MSGIAPPNGSPQVAEKRKSARKKSILRGKIVYDNGARTFDCIIRDISDNGARIEVPAGQIVPKHVVLIDMRTGNAYEAAVKWCKRSEMGVSFVRSFSLDGPLSSENRYLKHLWAGSFRGVDVDAPPPIGRAEHLRRMPVEAPARKFPDQTNVTPEMIGAGMAAYFLWKPAEFRRVYSEPDMVCAVFRAMIRAARGQPDDQMQDGLSAPAGE